MIFGDRLVSYLAKKDRQKFFHPELQGELLFGLEESKSASLGDTIENMRWFLAQTKEWKGAEAQIYSYRDEVTQSKLPGSDDLAKAVNYEVRYVEALWSGNLIEALGCCKGVLGNLSDSSLVRDTGKQQRLLAGLRAER